MTCSCGSARTKTERRTLGSGRKIFLESCSVCGAWLRSAPNTTKEAPRFNCTYDWESEWAERGAMWLPSGAIVTHLGMNDEKFRKRAYACAAAPVEEDGFA